MTKQQRYLKLLVTYDGSAYSGFQFQPDRITVQGELERAFRVITRKQTRAIGSGRTDAGVHALEQVVLFRTGCPIPLDKLIIGMNGALPGSLRVSGAEEVDEDFHPRFSAKGKHYRYLFRLIEEPSPFLERFFWQIQPELDIEKMQLAARNFVGEHDFASFAKSPQRYESTVRHILSASVQQKERVISFDVEGTGFMHNMVRNMAKALYLIGTEQMAGGYIYELYRNQNRESLGAPAPPGGLYLMKVKY
ncbi:MAG: tRNA pseudouridine(38-40) synthase TruA [Candidatus Rifleibacteriota bacterium]